MDLRSFRLSCFVVVAACVVIGTIGFFMNRQAEINRSADVAKAEIGKETQQIVQDKKTERTKERWAVLPWNRDKPKLADD